MKYDDANNAPDDIDEYEVIKHQEERVITARRAPVHCIGE
jgi:hypothetical protein